ncbi:MAG: biotin/lipoate A/B protein ligase family protein [Novipirellula sp. JB048]
MNANRGIQARLIELAAGGPAENMAIDQALLESAHHDVVPTLRLYSWSEPTLSLGYFQNARDRSTHPPSSTAALVRRATGGGAIVHHHELTYSFIWPLPNASPGAKAELYRQTHRAIVQALRSFGVEASRFGDHGNPTLTPTVARRADPSAATLATKPREPFLCFQRRSAEDLILSGYKILGSAQRTSRQAVLQHGSLLLEVTPSAPELPGVVDLTSRRVPIEQLAVALTAAMAQAFQLEFEKYVLGAASRRRVQEIVSERFGQPAWNEKR